MHKAAYSGLLLLLAFAVAAEGEENTVKPSPSSERSRAKPALEQLVSQLAARGYRTRQAAHRRIAQLDTDALPILLRAQKTATDPEILRRLDLLIPGLEARAMFLPKYVTLRPDRQLLPDILAEITRQTGYTFNFDNNNNTQLLTFHMTRVPFWEALDQICQKAHLTIYPYYYNNDTIRLQSYGTAPGPYVKYQGTFRLVVTGFSYYRGVTFSGAADGKAAPAQRSESLSLNLNLLTEPKLPFLQVQSALIREAYDDQNRPMTLPINLTATAYPNASPSPYGNGTRLLATSVSANLRRPGRNSKTAKLVRGEIPVLLLGKQKPEIEMENPLAIKKKSFRSGKTEIEVDSVTPQNNLGNGRAFQISMSIKEDTAMQAYDYAWQNTLASRLELLDARGQRYPVWTSNLYNRGPRHAQGSIVFHSNINVPLGPPVKLVYNRWTAVQHTIKFEFRDLPLP